MSKQIDQLLIIPEVKVKAVKPKKNKFIIPSNTYCNALLTSIFPSLYLVSLVISNSKDLAQNKIRFHEYVGYILSEDLAVADSNDKIDFDTYDCVSIYSHIMFDEYLHEVNCWNQTKIYFLDQLEYKFDLLKTLTLDSIKFKSLKLYQKYENIDSLDKT